MKTILLTLALSCSLQLVFAQQDSLLRVFKFRNINYRAVNLDINGNSNFRDQEMNTGNSRNSESGGNIGGSFDQIKSTDRILLMVSGSIATSMAFGRVKDPGSDRKNRSYSVAPALFLLNKWFYGNFFTELGTDISTSFYTGKLTAQSQTVSENDYGFQSVAITAGLGKGRLENITNMQNALWLNKALEREGRLSQSLTPAELNDLGQAINTANNTRILDARKRTQFILEAIDSFFQERHLISKTDIRYFSNLNDILFFAINDYRQSGTEKFIRAKPGIVNYTENSATQLGNSKKEEDSRNLSVNLAIGINKYVPVNLKHQNNFGVAVHLNYVSNRYNLKFFTSGIQDIDTSEAPTLRQAAFVGFYQHAIYPNTRTIIRFNLNTQTGYQYMDEGSGFLSADLGTDLSYFISYRTRVSCNMGVSYRKNLYDAYKYLTLMPETVLFNLGASLQVSL